MKQTIMTLICLALLATFVSSQTKRADQRTQETEKNLTDRLGIMIEDFVDKVTREFSSDRNIVSVDTIPDIQSKTTRASITFDGNKVIEEDETIRANVVVKAGDLIVYGTVDGDVLVVGGTLYVKDGGRV
ncbi:MAG TPA: hypothetical protein VJB38_13630, partial [Bacteroidota bacterium]|nr:hypothetical protein [Bacteroidota bacterium]